MATGNQMQVDASVILQEAEVREAFLMNRTLLLSQQLLMQKQENQILLDKINGLEADLRLAKGEGEASAVESGNGASE